MTQMILSIDQGTTSSRAILFAKKGQIVETEQQEFPQIFPKDGWVEHDPESIWSTTLSVMQSVLSRVNLDNVVGLGITNQRETTLVWNKKTGKPIYNAIVWQDRRTAEYCRSLQDESTTAMICERTGLLPDPYFSATKIRWILNHVDGAKEAAERGDLLFGTVDTFLLWRLTGGRRHATDATNASRTLLFNIKTQQWDSDLLSLFEIPESMLPEVLDCADDFGTVDHQWCDKSLPIAAMAGDQQAALFGQACFKPGMVKSTYGTGCFMIVNTGDQMLTSSHQLLTTVGYRLQGKTTYALEGSIFMAGAVMQWLRDGVGLLNHASDSEAMAEDTGAENLVYLIPAFTGLGAPYWNPDARGAIVGLTRDTTSATIVTAGLQSIAYQTKDLVNALSLDGTPELHRLRVDGGLVVNDWAVQFIADMLQVSVDRPVITETTALGVAFMAGLQLGIYESLDDIAQIWACERTFDPIMPEEQMTRLYSGWTKAVAGVQLMAR